MEEDCDMKPCEIKVECEPILDDDFGYNYAADPCQEANSEVSNPDLLKYRSLAVSERLDLSLLNDTASTVNLSCRNANVPDLTAQIKVENTEDEDPLAGVTPSDEQPMPPERTTSFFFKEETAVFLQDVQIKTEYDSSEEVDHQEEMPSLISSESGDETLANGILSQNCKNGNTYSRTRIKTHEIKDATFDIGQDSDIQTLQNASNTNCHSEKLSAADSEKRPFPRTPHQTQSRDQDGLEADPDSGKSRFSCEQCSARFTQRSNLARHLLIHSGEKPFCCKHCPALFSDKSNLSKHLRIHSGEKPFSCKHCPTRFNQKSDLTKHLRIHSGEKPFSCIHCPARFSDKSNLNKHSCINSDEKPFLCKHCPARFNQKSCLNTHLRIHSGEKPFSCKLCPARFNQSSNLTSHLRIHSGEKPFSCKHCPARFNQKNSLNTHLRIHSGEKPFSCKHCSARFTRRNFLTKHLILHFGEEEVLL